MKCRVNRLTMRAFLARALSYSAVAALTLNPVLTPVVASDYRATPAPAMAAAPTGAMNARFLPLGVGKSVVIDLPREVKDVLVGDPKIANAVIRSAQRAYIIGAAVGQTNIVFFDASGGQIAAYDIAVTRDLNGVRAALKQIAPTSDIQIEGIGDSVVLTGTAQHADRIAAGRRRRGAPRRRRRQGRQLDRGARPRPGHAQGHRRRSLPLHHQAARHRPQRQPQLRQRVGGVQQLQSVHGAGPLAGCGQRRADDVRRHARA